MPNTFSMAPGYVARYVEDHHLVAPEVNVIDAVRRRVQRLGLDTRARVRGRAWLQAAETATGARIRQSAKLIFTSPPYLHVMKYGKFNWLRLWLLGESPTVLDQSLFSSSSLPRYLDFIREVLQQLGHTVAPDGYVCMVIGDVETQGRTVRLAEEVAEHAVNGSSFRTLGILEDHLPSAHKVSRIWGTHRGKATKTDRILILGGRHARSPKPMPAVDWRRS
jgi:site-specific DNA-methyltransferase (adenine-specific)